MTRKVLIWGIVVVAGVIVILAGINIYLIQKRKNQGETGEANLVQNVEWFSEDLGSASQEKQVEGEGVSGPIEPSEELPLISQISDKKVMAATLNREGDRVIFFEKGTGLMYSTSFLGMDEEQKTFTKQGDLLGVEWSPDKQRVIFIKPTTSENDNVRYEIFNVTNESTSALNENIEKVIWNEAGDKIIYFYNSPDKETLDLSLADEKGQNYQVVKRFSKEDLWISRIPTTQKVMFFGAPTYKVMGEIRTVNLANGREGVIISGMKAAIIKWSPDGTKGFLQRTSEEDDAVVENLIINQDGVVEKTLKTRTFAEKVTWSADSKYLYMGIPLSEIGLLVPDDYLEGRVDVKDAIARVDIESGEVKQITKGDEFQDGMDVTNLFLSADSKKLFFTNQKDGRLYVVNL
jgi:Tol biopolymer transport system component